MTGEVRTNPGTNNSEEMPDSALTRISTIDAARRYLIDSADELRALYPDANEHRGEEFDYLDWIGAAMIDLAVRVPAPSERSACFVRWTSAYALATVQLS